MSELSTAATNILNRLVAAPTYHPGNADLFTDWNLQAGDVVTVAADGENYSVPIYNMKLKWTGQSKVEVESTGNPKREPPPAVNRKSYGSAAGGYGGQKQLSDTLHAAGLFVDPETGVWAYASEQGEDYALGATFSVQSTAINLKVSKGSVSTQLAVECGNVHVSGGNLTVDGYITSEGLKTTIIQVQGVDCRGDIDSQGVRADSIFYDGADLGDAVAGFGQATPSGGTITIPYTTISGGSGSITFNIADTEYYQQAVSAAWANGYSAGVSEAAPDGVSVTTNATTPTAAGSAWYSTVTIETTKNGETQSTFPNKYVNVTAPYNAGAASVTLSGAWSTSSSSSTYTVTATNGETDSASVSWGGNWDSSNANLFNDRVWSGNTQVLSRTIDATSRYTAGQNSVAINKGGWDTSNKKIEFTKSVGTASTKSVVLSGSVGSYDATNKKYVVSVYDDGTRWTGLDVDVNASDAFSAGASSISISRVQNNSGTQTIYNDSSGNLTIYVYVRLSSGTSGTYTINVPYRCID